MTEKRKIEKCTAEEFLVVYNEKFNATFAVKEQSDYPNIVCEDKDGNQLKLEITLTENKDDDIKALLGRSEHKSLEHARKREMEQAHFQEM